MLHFSWAPLIYTSVDSPSLVQEHFSTLNGLDGSLDDLTDFSPLDLGTGPFVAGTDWDMLAQFFDQQNPHRLQSAGIGQSIDRTQLEIPILISSDMAF